MAEPKANRERFSPPAVGGISLLAVFAVLCLTIFALLSLATVGADVRLADASVKAVTDYYKADYEAQEILAKLRAGEFPSGVTQSGDIYRYSCPVSEIQNLEVSVQVASDGSYHVLEWKTVPAQLWELDEEMELWDGTF